MKDQYVAFGNRATMLAALEPYPHLLACKFCHRRAEEISFKSVDPKLEIARVTYRCRTKFLQEDSLWVRKCHWLTGFTIVFKLCVRLIAYALLLMVKDE